jgi:uroporphyrinogen-III synthase
MKQPLAGKGVVVTRPAHQAEPLARAIAAAGGRAILFPAIEIRDVEDLTPFMRVVDELEEFDLAVFISPNAAERAIGMILARRTLPAGLRIAAIGGGGLRALAARGVTGVIAPEARYDSETLLELPEVATARRVAIFRGAGGREHLGEALRARGATVAYAECYRRCRPEADPKPLLDAWSRKQVDAVAVTSSEGLRNVFEMVTSAGHAYLQGTPLFAPHPRIAQAARELGVRTVVVTGPGDEGLLTGLAAFFGANAHRP